MIFSAPMVRAILEGRKTQTRRVIKPQPEYFRHDKEKWELLRTPDHRPLFPDSFAKAYAPLNVGDRFYVRETWADVNSEAGPSILYKSDRGMRSWQEFSTSFGPNYGAGPSMDYKSYPGNYSMWWSDLLNEAEGHSWRSPIHMPEWAARIHCEITDVRTQRVQEITKDDVIAEGMQIPVRESETPDKVVPYLRITGKCEPPYKWPQKPVESDYYRHEFAFCWDEINGPGSWDANPFVWAYTFRRIEKGGAS